MATNTFKSGDDVLKELVSTRRDEVVLLQNKQTEQIKDLETRGAKRLADLKKTLPKDFVAVLDSLDKIHHQSVLTTKSTVDEIKAELVDSSLDQKKTKLRSIRVLPEIFSSHPIRWDGSHRTTVSCIGTMVLLFGRVTIPAI